MVLSWNQVLFNSCLFEYCSSERGTAFRDVTKKSEEFTLDV